MSRTPSHGHRHDDVSTPEYEAWRSMKARCDNPHCDSWPYFGGKGITVCAEWRMSFPAFLRDVGKRPARGFLLSRKDKSKPFRPGNVYWASIREAGRHRSVNKVYSVGATKLCLQDWAARSGIGKSTLHYRLAHGLSMQKAIERGHGGQGKVLAP